MVIVTLVLPVMVSVTVLSAEPTQAVNVLVPGSAWNTTWPAGFTAVLGPNVPVLPACATVAAAWRARHPGDEPSARLEHSASRSLN